MTAWFADQEVTRFLKLRLPPSLEAEQEWVRAAGRDPDSVLWAIEAGGHLAGTTGLHRIDWQNRNASTGTLIGERALWGQGLATELMRLRAAYAFRELNLHKLNSSFLEGNEGSRRAQEKAGYRVVGRRRQQHFRGGRWLDEILTELLREDWETALG